jgi:bacillolysin/neutral peptidase B
MAVGLRRIEFTAGAEEVPAELAKTLVPPTNALDEDFDTIARRYLEALFTGPVQPNETFKGFAGTDVAPDRLLPELVYHCMQDVALTGTTVAQYWQSWSRVPIYGARIGVEMTSYKQLVGVNGYLADPGDVDPIATLSPAAAYKHLSEIAGYVAKPGVAGDAPHLMLRYDDQQSRFRLAYVFDYVRIVDEPAPEQKDAAGTVHTVDADDAISIYRVFIDAHDGTEIARIPLRHSLGAIPANGNDTNGVSLHFTATETTPGSFLLEDPVRRLRTLSMQFNDIDCGPMALPGNAITSNNAIFAQPAAVRAHVHAGLVYDFYTAVLKRNGIDDKGMWIVSAVECLAYRVDPRTGACGPINPAQKDWKNAAWIRDPSSGQPAFLRTGMMVYGQVTWPNGKSHSLCESLDVVGHELTHGVTSYSCDLEYRIESGAMNESYSDIFGVAIANSTLPDVAGWEWRLGTSLDPNGTPIRDMSNPAARGQPADMASFVKLPPNTPASRRNDMGFVHKNSGVHNKAAYNLFTAGVFTWQEVIQMFYLTLVTRLTATSGFSDSKAGMVTSCRSLFSRSANLQARLDAVAKAFSDVGIT